MKATAIAHPNIALVKYWGKREPARNLPAAGSVSLTLGPMHTRTTVAWGAPADVIRLNGETANERDQARLSRFLDRVRALRPDVGGAEVDTANDFPTGAGLASSSSGFAALAVAATAAAGLQLGGARLSELARLGSGSAARSIFGGFVRMDPGAREDGADAVAAPIDTGRSWPLRAVIAITTERGKEVGSTDGMTRTQETSPYFRAWVETVAPAMDEAVRAIRAEDFSSLGRVAESSALAMHASAMAAQPGVLYWNGATVECIHAVRRWREQESLPVFFTIDAGPHVKVFTTLARAQEVEERLRAVPGVLRTLLAAPAGPATLVA